MLPVQGEDFSLPHGGLYSEAGDFRCPGVAPVAVQCFDRVAGIIQGGEQVTCFVCRQAALSGVVDLGLADFLDRVVDLDSPFFPGGLEKMT